MQVILVGATGLRAVEIGKPLRLWLDVFEMLKLRHREVSLRAWIKD